MIVHMLLDDCAHDVRTLVSCTILIVVRAVSIARNPSLPRAPAATRALLVLVTVWRQDKTALRDSVVAHDCFEHASRTVSQLRKNWKRRWFECRGTR